MDRIEVPGGGGVMTKATRETYGVTPPSLDSQPMREWIEGKARSAGWSELRWSTGTDATGWPCGRLTGVKPPEVT